MARIKAPSSIRAQYGSDTTRNACHGSDTHENARIVCLISSRFISHKDSTLNALLTGIQFVRFDSSIHLISSLFHELWLLKEYKFPTWSVCYGLTFKTLLCRKHSFSLSAGIWACVPASGTAPYVSSNPISSCPVCFSKNFGSLLLVKVLFSKSL